MASVLRINTSNHKQLWISCFQRFTVSQRLSWESANFYTSDGVQCVNPYRLAPISNQYSQYDADRRHKYNPFKREGSFRVHATSTRCHGRPHIDSSRRVIDTRAYHSIVWRVATWPKAMYILPVTAMSFAERSERKRSSVLFALQGGSRT